MTATAFASEELAERVRAVRAVMRERGLAALCVVSPENVYYLSGLNHQGHFAFTQLVLPLEGRPRLVTRAMERATVAAQARDLVHVPYADDEDPAAAAADALRQVTGSGDRIGIERASMHLPVAIWEGMCHRLDDLEWADGSGIVEVPRAVKSPAELELIRRAAAISDDAVQAGIRATRAGVTERTVAAAVYQRLLLAGSDHPGIPPMIRGRDILLQEHVIGPRDRVLTAGDALFMELSGSVAHYHAPASRMVYVREVPAGTEQAAKIASDGLEAVRAALRPGAVAGEVYAAWQRVIDEGLGHSRYRRHHCGYLVGIGFAPSWVGGSTVVGLRDGADLVIREGMVFHVLSWILDQRPADYILSDTVLVTASGGELLTTTPREPTVVP